jgi:O-antigen/teichoic acid export membrane protein
MSFVQQIIKNIAALTFSVTVFGAAFFVFNIFAARYLGDAEFGKYSFAVAFNLLFATLPYLSMDVIVTRDVTLDKSLAKKYFSNVFFLQIILSICTLFIIVLVTLLTQSNSDTMVAVYVIAVSTIAMSFLALCRAIFRAFERMAWDMFPTAVGIIFLIAGSLFIIITRSDAGLMGITGIYTLTYILTSCIAFAVVIKKFTGLSFNIDFKLWRKLLVMTIPFALNGVLFPLSRRIDVVILSYMQDEAVVGWYNAASTLSTIPFLLVTVGFARALFPYLAHAFFQTDKKIYITLIEKAIRYSVIILFPVGAGVTMLSSRITSILLGPEYNNSAAPLQLLIWSGILLFFNYFYINLMEATGKQKKATFLIGIGAAINILLNLLLIPKFSLIGAAIASLISQFVCLIIGYYQAEGTGNIKTRASSTLKPAIASVLMGVFLFYLNGLNIILLVFSAAVVYFIVLYLIGGITGEELKSLKRLVRLKKTEEQ